MLRKRCIESNGTPRALDRPVRSVRYFIEENSAFGRRMVVHETGVGAFLVDAQSNDCSKQYGVNIGRSYCSCGHWRGLGYPCAHPRAAILTGKGSLEELTRSFFVVCLPCNLCALNNCIADARLVSLFS